MTKPKNVMSVRHLVDDREVIEHAKKCQRWIQEVTGNTSMFTLHQNVCSEFFHRVRNPLNESQIPHIATGNEIINLLNRLDQFDKLDINIGSTVSIINGQLSGSGLELWGFTNPKVISKIFKDGNDDHITQFEFNNDPTDVYPRVENGEYNGQFLMHSAFFGNKKDADHALLMINLVASGDLQISNHVITEVKMSSILAGLLLNEGEVVPFRKKDEGHYKNLPKEILILAKECYKKAKEQQYEEYHTNAEYRNHIDSELGQIANEVENLGYRIGEDEKTGDIVIENPGNKRFVLPARDAENSTGWASNILREDNESIPLKFNTTALNNWPDIRRYVIEYYAAYGINKIQYGSMSNLQNIMKDKNRLLESVDYTEIKPFEQAIYRVSTKTNIKIGDMFAAMLFEMQYMSNHIEVSGFTIPKKIVEIKLDTAGAIGYVKFDDGDIFPRVPMKTGKGGINFLHPAYFDSQTDAEKALTYLTLMLPHDWEMSTDTLNNLSESINRLKEESEMNSNDNSIDPEVTIPGIGKLNLSRLKRKAENEVDDLANQIHSGKYRNAAYNVDQFVRTLKALAKAAQPKADIDEADDRVHYPIKSLDGVEKGFPDRNSPAATNWAQSRQRKEKRIADPWKVAKQKKPSSDEVWDKITTVVGNMFPDGDPIDFLYPWLEQNGLDYTALAKACRKNGYKDLEDYWKDLEKSTGIHSGTYGEPIDEDPDYPAVSNQPGGWRQVKLRPAGQLNEREGSSEGVYDAIRHRMTTQHLDVVSKFGPVKVMAAIEDRASNLNDLEEIGSSDISGWTRQVIQNLERGYYDHLDEGNSFNAGTSYRPKQAGTFAEDITGHSSGQSYRKFKPKQAGTLKPKKKTESAILKGIQNESRNAGK